MNDTEYVELLKRRPFGWGFDESQILDSYQFERIDPFYWKKFVEDNWKACYYVGAIYILTIFGLKEYMKNRPAYKLKTALFLWNLANGVISIFGFVRAAPSFVAFLSQPNGFYNSICVKEGINVQSVYWGLLFAFSKFWELGDTVFIVLRKRPLVFLQWYHHLATLCVVWTLAPLVEPIGRWYGILNAGVHSFMYPYFALKTIGVFVPNWIANIITTLQLSQMIIGFTVNITSFYLQRNGYDCARYPISINAFIVVYGSFIILFGRLFYQSVLMNGRGKRASAEKQKLEKLN